MKPGTGSTLAAPLINTLALSSKQSIEAIQVISMIECKKNPILWAVGRKIHQTSVKLAIKLPIGSAMIFYKCVVSCDNVPDVTSCLVSCDKGTDVTCCESKFVTRDLMSHVVLCDNYKRI